MSKLILTTVVILIITIIVGVIKFSPLNNFSPALNFTGSTNTPFNLKDPEGTYKIQKLGNSYTLNYTDKDGIIKSIYINTKKSENLDEYLNKNVQVSGYLKTEKQEIQCIKAPCNAIEKETFVITSIKAK